MPPRWPPKVRRPLEFEVREGLHCRALLVDFAPPYLSRAPQTLVDRGGSQRRERAPTPEPSHSTQGRSGGCTRYPGGMGRHLTAESAYRIRQAQEARRGLGRYERYRGAFVEDLAREYGVTPRVIRNAIRRRTYVLASR